MLVGALLFPGLAAFIAASVISALSLKFGQRNVGRHRTIIMYGISY